VDSLSQPEASFQWFETGARMLDFSHSVEIVENGCCSFWLGFRSVVLLMLEEVSKPKSGGATSSLRKVAHGFEVSITGVPVAAKFGRSIARTEVESSTVIACAFNEQRMLEPNWDFCVCCW